MYILDAYTRTHLPLNAQNGILQHTIWGKKKNKEERSGRNEREQERRKKKGINNNKNTRKVEKGEQWEEKEKCVYITRENTQKLP